MLGCRGMKYSKLLQSSGFFSPNWIFEFLVSFRDNLVSFRYMTHRAAFIFISGLEIVIFQLFHLLYTNLPHSRSVCKVRCMISRTLWTIWTVSALVMLFSHLLQTPHQCSSCHLFPCAAMFTYPKQVLQCLEKKISISVDPDLRPLRNTVHHASLSQYLSFPPQICIAPRKIQTAQASQTPMGLLGYFWGIPVLSLESGNDCLTHVKGSTLSDTERAPWSLQKPSNCFRGGKCKDVET